MTGFGDAWDEAVAALPEGWRLGSLVAAVGFNGTVTTTVGWTATAYDGFGIPARDQAEAYAVTPALALHFLADYLRRHGDELLALRGAG